MLALNKNMIKNTPQNHHDDLTKVWVVGSSGDTWADTILG